MWTSSIAVAARIAPALAFGPAQSSTNIGRRRLPPAPSVAPASSARRSPWPATSSVSRSSTAAISRGSQSCAASIACVTGGGTAERLIGSYLGAVAEWIAMMPPARITYRTCSSPASLITAASPSGGGKRFTDSGR